jgi:hypothetical protein
MASTASHTRTRLPNLGFSLWLSFSSGFVVLIVGFPIAMFEFVVAATIFSASDLIFDFLVSCGLVDGYVRLVELALSSIFV